MNVRSGYGSAADQNTQPSQFFYNLSTAHGLLLPFQRLVSGRISDTMTVLLPGVKRIPLQGLTHIS